MQQIAEDIRRPRYFNPYEAIEYTLIDKVLEPEEAALKQIAREQLGLSELIRRNPFTAELGQGD